MATLSIELPDTLLLGTGQSPDEFLKEARFLLSLKLFELGRISSGKAAEISGMSRLDFLFAAGRSGVPVADLDEFEAWGERRDA
jgi:predicted HTH domain antitoxin